MVQGIGYFPNASKTWLVTKEGFHDDAISIFANTGVSVTPNGRPYLGAAIGSQEYVTGQVKSKVNECISNIQCLATIAVTQPHAAFSALTHGLTSRWTYLSRTIPDIGPLLRPLDDTLHSVLLPALMGRPPPSDLECTDIGPLLRPLDDTLHSVLLPALTGRPPPSDLECTLFALPARLGGLGIGIPSRSAIRELHSPLLVTSTLCDHILAQDHEYEYEIIVKQLEAKALVHQENYAKTSADAEEIHKLLPTSLWRSVDLAKEKGASTWLTALPSVEHGFTLHKGAFRDALALRYGWTPSEMPSMCTCGSKFSVEHALSCAKGRFPSIRHNEICNLTATLLTEVCYDVSIEPGLQPVTNETLTGATANCQDGAQLDIAASGFWGGTYERTFFDVRVFNPHAPSNRHTQLSSCYRKHEQIKKHATKNQRSRTRLIHSSSDLCHRRSC